MQRLESKFCTKKPQNRRIGINVLLSLYIISDFYDVLLVFQNKRGLGYSDCGIFATKRISRKKKKKKRVRKAGSPPQSLLIMNTSPTAKVSRPAG
jgi:hypothetical protein